MYIITEDNKIIHLNNYLVGDNYIGIDTVDSDPKYHLGVFKPLAVQSDDPVLQHVISFATFQTEKAAETALDDLFEKMGKTTTWNAKDYKIVGNALEEKKKRNSE